MKYWKRIEDKVKGNFKTVRRFADLEVARDEQQECGGKSSHRLTTARTLLQLFSQIQHPHISPAMHPTHRNLLQSSVNQAIS
jgi:hypothetical protein